MNLDTLENWHDFKRRFARPPNIVTARRKVRTGVWPGRVDTDGDVWIYSVRYELSLSVPDKIDALALQLIGS